MKVGSEMGVNVELLRRECNRAKLASRSRRQLNATST